MKWFVKCLRNYVNFLGRARRKEYWFFNLFSAIFMAIAYLLDWLIFGNPNAGISTCVWLFLLLPSLSVLVRRMHDLGRSGKIVLAYCLFFLVWLLVAVVMGISSFLAMSGTVPPISVGLLVVLGVGGAIIFAWSILFVVWCCLPGTHGDNKYGPDPKAE